MCRAALIKDVGMPSQPVAQFSLRLVITSSISLQSVFRRAIECKLLVSDFGVTEKESVEDGMQDAKFLPTLTKKLLTLLREATGV